MRTGYQDGWESHAEGLNADHILYVRVGSSNDEYRTLNHRIVKLRRCIFVDEWHCDHVDTFVHLRDIGTTTLCAMREKRPE
jgi:hypothetical protein